MAKQDLDKSQLDRQLLGDLAALIAVRHYVNYVDNAELPTRVAIVERLDGEIAALVNELWPTG